MSIGAGPQPSNFPYGFALGALVRGVAIQPSTPGKVLWVYNGNQLAPQGRFGADGNSGSFDSPKATIAGALLQCAPGRGDVIYVKPGHIETINSATALALNVAGVQVIGLGAGASRPTLNFATSAAATIAMSAAGCGLINFNINGFGFASIAAMITVTAADCAVQGCTLTMSNVTNQAVLGISATAAANGLFVDSNIILSSAAAGATAAVQLVGGGGSIVTNNVMEGQFSAGVGAISNITTAATDLMIQNNLINNTTAASTKAITAVAGTTGMIAGNRMQILSGTAPITAAGMSWVGGNYYAATIATAGTLI